VRSWSEGGRARKRARSLAIPADQALPDEPGEEAVEGVLGGGELHRFRKSYHRGRSPSRTLRLPARRVDG
jgi:hypothetical protein